MYLISRLSLYSSHKYIPIFVGKTADFFAYDKIWIRTLDIIITYRVTPGCPCGNPFSSNAYSLPFVY
jgi:hypothetical protein